MYSLNVIKFTSDYPPMMNSIQFFKEEDVLESRPHQGKWNAAKGELAHRDDMTLSRLKRRGPN
jgi:hypothetical protein